MIIYLKFEAGIWYRAMNYYCKAERKTRTEEPRNSAFQGTSGFYALLQEMPYCQYIELKEKVSRDLESMLL